MYRPSDGISLHSEAGQRIGTIVPIYGYTYCSHTPSIIIAARIPGAQCVTCAGRGSLVAHFLDRDSDSIRADNPLMVTPADSRRDRWGICRSTVVLTAPWVVSDILSFLYRFWHCKGGVAVLTGSRSMARGDLHSERAMRHPPGRYRAAGDDRGGVKRSGRGRGRRDPGICPPDAPPAQNMGESLWRRYGKQDDHHDMQRPVVAKQLSLSR